MKISFKNLFDTDYTLVMRDWRNQEFVNKNMVNQGYITEENHIKYLQMLREKKDTRKVYVAFADDKPFAIVNFSFYPEENYIEPGMYIINENFLGKGLGHVLSYAYLEYMFGVMPNGEVHSTILLSNKTNLALKEKFGFSLHHKTTVKDESGVERKASVLYLTKAMWQESKNEIMKKILGKFPSIEIGEIPRC